MKQQNMNNNQIVLSLLCIIFFGLNSAALAGLTFTESSDIGSNLNTPTNVGTVAVGCNTVNGTIDWDANSGFPDGDDSDAIQLTVPAGVSISAIKLEIYNYQSTSGDGTATFRSFDNSVKFINNISGDVMRSDALGNAPPVGPTTFAFQISGIPGFDPETFNQIGDASFSYRVTITVGKIFIESSDIGSNLNTPTNVGTVAAGLNTVSGTIDWDANSGFPDGDDSDAIQLTVPAGVSITGIKLEIYNYQSTSGEGTATFRSFDNSVKFINNISGDVMRSDALGNVPPVGPTTFAFQISGIPGFDPETFNQIGDASFSYRVTITGTPRLVGTTIARAHIIRFQSEVGFTYTLQTTEDLEMWCDSLSTSSVQGNGSVMEFCIEALKSREFYRVRAE